MVSGQWSARAALLVLVALASTVQGQERVKQTDRQIDGLVFFDGHGPQRVAIAAGADQRDFFGGGAIGRNTVRGDGFVAVDLALDKVFHLGERHELQVRAEAFNLLNRANYGLPIRVLGNPGFGSAVETATPARVVQFAVKYSF